MTFNSKGLSGSEGVENSAKEAPTQVRSNKDIDTTYNGSMGVITLEFEEVTSMRQDSLGQTVESGDHAQSLEGETLRVYDYVENTNGETEARAYTGHSNEEFVNGVS